MQLATLLAGTLLAGALALPAPGTDSRARHFCGAWLGLTDGAKQDLLARASSRDASSPTVARCHAGLRPGLRLRLDAECESWRHLMDFEVRAFVDQLLRSCDGAR